MNISQIWTTDFFTKFESQEVRVQENVSNLMLFMKFAMISCAQYILGDGSISPVLSRELLWLAGAGRWAGTVIIATRRAGKAGRSAGADRGRQGKQGRQGPAGSAGQAGADAGPCRLPPSTAGHRSSLRICMYLSEAPYQLLQLCNIQCSGNS